MNRTIAFDSSRDRLVYLLSAPDPEYWDGLWRSLITRSAIKRGNRFVTEETLRVLTPGARVVDAGCGIGATVSGLIDAGFSAEGIDNAEETIALINNLAPELKVRVGDVRALPYDTGELDGVWSLGVIEHFLDGYEPLITEANRVLRPGGYLFLTVPVISPFKRLKLRLKHYQTFDSTQADRFFQFAFHPRHVVDSICAQGFRLVRSHGQSGAFGLTEDAPALSRLLMLSQNATVLPARAWWRLADFLLTPACHHTRFFLFQKV